MTVMSFLKDKKKIVHEHPHPLLRFRRSGRASAAGGSTHTAMETAGTLQVPWDALSESVYGDMRVARASARERPVSARAWQPRHHPADAEIRLALEHREDARVRVINALERAGATPLTIRQVRVGGLRARLAFPLTGARGLTPERIGTAGGRGHGSARSAGGAGRVPGLP